ncbi:MAG: hypothetical protein ACR2N4_14865 [Jatrophihabitans sp.]
MAEVDRQEPGEPLEWALEDAQREEREDREHHLRRERRIADQIVAALSRPREERPLHQQGG